MPLLKPCKLSTRLRSLLLISTALAVLSGCSTAIKEENFYTDKGADGAVITHLFSTDSQDISKAAWDVLREGMTCMTANTIADLKGEIEQLCTKTSCDEETQSIREQLLVVLNAHIERIKQMTSKR